MRHYSITRSRGTTASACLLCILLWGVSGAWAGDGVVALQTADASCRTTTTPPPRYVDCGNGTVTDNLTGLVWLKQANCLAKCSATGALCTVDSDCGGGTCDPTAVDWFTAVEFVAGLSDKPAGSVAAAHDCGLSDGSSPGEWRLPSVEEWEAMVAVADGLGCSPTITNDAGNDCWDAACVTAGACSFSGVVSSFYWSASTLVYLPTVAWGVSLVNGVVGGVDKTFVNYVWPVRGGQ